ncbi:hypothetical protein BRARA_D01984 [Brassica rapa]|uniref:Anaphase-promoting complex subunit 4 WD40 domain-containing protein n=1 Tax=Brassica campestris TaxID=3711 RepID=A0A397ZN30_BRACM|nr:hypothetical protein BRARA_D01984 [Brassica rapa]
MEPFGDVGALEDNVESFLSQDDGDGGSIFSTLKRNPSEHAETSKGFSFSEVSYIRRSASKVICCSFSSDGNLLASAGHDKKVFIWNTQVRFQPISGKFLAAASDNTVSLVDVEKDIRVHLLKGHSSNVNSVYWNTGGELLASVSEKSVKLWSPSSGDCIHELSSSGNKFHSCVFHPSYPNLLVIGGYQENKCMTIPAHECAISALAQSPSTGMMASASHDKSVKIWK